MFSRSVASSSLRHCGLQPTRLLCRILQARILEWVAMPSSRGSSRPRCGTRVSCFAGEFFTTAPPGKPKEKRAGQIRKQACQVGSSGYLTVGVTQASNSENRRQLGKPSISPKERLSGLCNYAFSEKETKEQSNSAIQTVPLNCT